MAHQEVHTRVAARAPVNFSQFPVGGGWSGLKESRLASKRCFPPPLCRHDDPVQVALAVWGNVHLNKKFKFDIMAKQITPVVEFFF